MRKSKMRKADFYLCHSRASGRECESKLPPLLPGKIRVIDICAAGSFWGYSDVWPNAEEAASVMRAREILAAGITQMAIKKAQKRD
jgi:hypothetical protein